MFDLRLQGLSRRLPVTGLARHLLPWARGSVTVVVLTGVLLLLPQATHLGMSPLFRLKLTLLTLAGLNATLFHLGVFRSVQAWDTDAPALPLARASDIASLLLWAGVITGGRLLAYFRAGRTLRPGALHCDLMSKAVTFIFQRGEPSPWSGFVQKLSSCHHAS